MNREQQIEEFQNDIIDNLFDGGTYKLAEALYNAGYRKVSDSEAELQELNIKYYNEAKDLRRKLAEVEAEKERLSEKLKQVLLSIDTVKEMNAMCNIDEQRKQAVKEFAARMKKDPRINNYGLEFVALVDIDAELKSLLKEYE